MELHGFRLKSDYYYGKFSKYNNANTEGGVGTFYVAKLKSGDEVIVLIDDRTFTIPKSGTVKLPVASTKEMESTGFIEKLGAENQEKNRNHDKYGNV